MPNSLYLVFIVCHAVRWIPNIFEFTETDEGRPVRWPEWAHKVSQVSHLLTVLSSSVNFYIYLLKHGRREVSGWGRRTSPWTDSMAVSDNVSHIVLLSALWRN